MHWESAEWQVLLSYALVPPPPRPALHLCHTLRYPAHVDNEAWCRSNNSYSCQWECVILLAGHWLVGFEERTQLEVEELLKARKEANKTHKLGPS